MTELELVAAQAYIRLLQTARAALEDPRGAPLALTVLTPPMAEADQALAAAGLAGNERRLFELVHQVCPRLPVDTPA
ncbi:hypothetical protein ACIBI4_00780 [Streptomyces sp. NPDC050418]|uniref:hypothetical protein n=1 Tax=Streptomyces sp. NPDC050418 TaxID=3365612 RepID=UPI0037B4F093